MKKFYIQIFAAIFLLVSFSSQGQITYNSITSNPSNYTLDDVRYWIAGLQPPNPCNNCIININSNVSMVQNGASSDPANNCGGCVFLNDVVVNGTSINIYGTTTLSVNTYLQLFGVTVTLGNDPTSVQTFFVNDQVDIDAASSVQLANNFTVVDARNVAGNSVVGPHLDFTNFPPGTPDVAGIYSILPVPVGGFSYSYVLNLKGIGYANSAFGFYNFNCTGPAGCNPGVINGPAITGPTPGVPPATDYGIIFSPSTTLPVELVQFLANRNDDGSVKVSWATSQEENSNYYDVERSSDQSQWSSIGTVKARGFASTTTNYFLNDKSPVNGTGYYRLKMVDLDGKFTYSKAIPITTDQTNTALVIYSNPFSDQIRLKINVSGPQNLILTVTDMMGKTYISQSYQAQNGDNFVNLQPSIGSSGMYILRIQGNSYDRTVKLEKQ
jgi:Secretion system C-terminal sorting domain